MQVRSVEGGARVRRMDCATRDLDGLAVLTYSAFVHLYQAGEFHDAVTYIRLAFVPWEIEIPGSVRLSAARGSSVRPHTRGRAH